MTQSNQPAKVHILPIQGANCPQKDEIRGCKRLYIILNINHLHILKLFFEEKYSEKRKENFVALKKVVFLQSEKKEE